MKAHEPRSAARARKNTVLMMVAVLAAAAAACHGKSDAARPPAPAHDGIDAALAKFLKERGDLCLGKFSWPIEVTGREAELHTADAIQMPVLERLGLVGSTEIDGARSYALSELGRRFYLERKTPGARADLCAGRIELDHIVAIEAQAGSDGRPQVLVRYTYHFAAPDWVQDAGVRAAFPMLAHIVDGERKMPMELRLERVPAGWVALDPRA